MYISEPGCMTANMHYVSFDPAGISGVTSESRYEFAVIEALLRIRLCKFV